jgi:hypothetical protein
MKTAGTFCLMLAVACGLLLAVADKVSAEPAIVVRDAGPCGMPGADADGNIIFGGIGEATHIVENGNMVKLTCKGTEITNLSGRAQHFRGFPCGIILANGDVVISTDTHATISPNGQATMTCIYTKP